MVNPASRELVTPQRLRAFFAPKSIALVGASENSGWARFIVASCAATGFAGPLTAVHPRARTAFGLPVVPSLRDLWGHEYNVSFVKKVQIHERMRFELRVEAFNLWNHPIFGGDPSTSYTSTTYGQITVNSGQTNVPRQIELAGRLAF